MPGKGMALMAPRFMPEMPAMIHSPKGKVADKKKKLVVRTQPQSKGK
jgi:hypothetical protein